MRGLVAVAIALLLLGAIPAQTSAQSVSVPMPKWVENKDSHWNNYTFVFYYYTFRISIVGTEATETSIWLFIRIKLTNNDVIYFASELEHQSITFSLVLFNPYKLNHTRVGEDDYEWVKVDDDVAETLFPSNALWISDTSNSWEYIAGLSYGDRQWLYDTWEDWVSRGRPMIEEVRVRGYGEVYETSWRWQIGEGSGNIGLPGPNSTTISAIFNYPYYSLILYKKNMWYSQIEHEKTYGRERENNIKISAVSPTLSPGDRLQQGTVNIHSRYAYTQIMFRISDVTYFRIVNIYLPEYGIIGYNVSGQQERFVFYVNITRLKFIPLFHTSEDPNFLTSLTIKTLSGETLVRKAEITHGDTIVISDPDDIEALKRHAGEVLEVENINTCGASHGNDTTMTVNYYIVIEPRLEQLTSSFKILVSKKSEETEYRILEGDTSKGVFAFDTVEGMSGPAPDWWYRRWVPGVRAVNVGGSTIEFAHVELVDFGQPGTPKIPVLIYGPSKGGVEVPENYMITIAGGVTEASSAGKLTIHSYWVRNRSGNLTALENVNWMTYETAKRSEEPKRPEDDPWTEDELKEWILEQEESIIVVYPVGTPLALWYDNYDEANRTFDLVIRYGYPIELSSITMTLSISDKDGVHYQSYTIYYGGNITVGTFNETRFYVAVGEWTGYPLWADRGSSVFVPEMIHSPSASYVSPAVQYLTWTIIFMVLFTILLLKRRWW